MMPATYNIEYYRGDTLTFYLDVKSADGSPVDLTGYTMAFTVATARGDDPPEVNGYPGSVVCAATLKSGHTSIIECTITPENGSLLQAGTPYVYDVQVTSGGNVTTYLTGNINITEGVS